MAHASPSLADPFAFLDWRPRARAVTLAGRAPAERAHPINAGRLGSFVASLWRVCDTVAQSTPARGQLRFSCVVNGEPPTFYLDTLIRLAQFLLADAADACANSEATGRISVCVELKGQHLVLSVEHDGWSQPPRGVDRHLAWARRIAEASGGDLFRRIDWDRTVTRIALPSMRRHST